MIKNRQITKETLASMLLLTCAVLAMVVNNSPLCDLYNQFLHIKLTISFDDAGLSKPILLWINDGLMAIFFLLVGLELKREIVAGELSQFKKVILPIVGAIGGMLAPIIIYCLYNQYNSAHLEGWAIPMATDIAFALGVLSVFGRRVPLQLKLFLLTLAIIDDLGAILVIGIFHTQYISWQALGYAQAAIIVLMVLNIFNVKNTSVYLLFGFFLWLSTLQSGFHATIAGVILALTIPVTTRDGYHVLHELEENLKPLVNFYILPIFAFANSGVPLNNISISDISHPIVLGTSLGLIIGNSIGISILTMTTKKIFNIKTSFSNLDLLGVAFLCGIGFTMSLFISGLAFNNDIHIMNLSRLGIILGSLVSMILGMFILQHSLPKLKKN